MASGCALVGRQLTQSHDGMEARRGATWFRGPRRRAKRDKQPIAQARPADHARLPRSHGVLLCKPATAADWQWPLLVTVPSTHGTPRGGHRGGHSFTPSYTANKHLTTSLSPLFSGRSWLSSAGLRQSPAPAIRTRSGLIGRVLLLLGLTLAVRIGAWLFFRRGAAAAAAVAVGLG